MKKIKKFFKFTLISCFTLVVFAYVGRFFFNLFWDFDIISPKSYKVLKNYWNNGGSFKEFKELSLLICLILFPKASVKCFAVFGMIIKILAFVGLALAIFTFLTKIEISPHFDTLENGAFICVNACVTLSGALPAMAIISKLLNKPLTKLASKIGLNGVSAVALLGNLVTNVSSVGVMDKMDKKGVVVNAAFAVSAAFVFGGHLAFTMAFDQAYVLPMIIGKLVAGVSAIVLACVLYKNSSNKI